MARAGAIVDPPAYRRARESGSLLAARAYAPPPAYAPGPVYTQQPPVYAPAGPCCTYPAAGRDANGFLTWPGKR